MALAAVFLTFSAEPAGGSILGSLLLASIRWIASFILSYVAGKALDAALFQEGRQFEDRLRQREIALVRVVASEEVEWELREVRDALRQVQTLLYTRVDRATVERLEREVRQANVRVNQRLAELESRVFVQEERMLGVESDLGTLQAQLNAAFAEIDRINARLATPSFYPLRLGEFFTIGLGGGILGTKIASSSGEITERAPRPAVILRWGTRWSEHLGAGTEFTASVWGRRDFQVSPDSALRLSSHLTEWEGTGAVVLYWTLAQDFPLTTYGGLCFDVVGARYRGATATNTEAGPEIYHSESLGYLVGAGFDWQRLPWVGVTVFARFHRTFDNRNIYEDLTGGRRLDDRWTVLGGVGVTFNLE